MHYYVPVPVHMQRRLEYTNLGRSEGTLVHSQWVRFVLFYYGLLHTVHFVFLFSLHPLWRLTPSPWEDVGTPRTSGTAGSYVASSHLSPVSQGSWYFSLNIPISFCNGFISERGLSQSIPFSYMAIPTPLYYINAASFVSSSSSAAQNVRGTTNERTNDCLARSSWI